MAVTNQNSTEYANLIAVPLVRNETTDWNGRLRFQRFTFTQSGAGDATSTVTLTKLPAGRVRVFNRLTSITYCTVTLPSFEREYRKWYYSDVRPEIYDMVLRENKSRLLEHIQKLNAVEHSVHLTAFGVQQSAPNSLQMSLFAEVSPATIGGR